VSPLLYEDHVAVHLVVVGLARRGVLGDESIDEVFDGGICGMVFGGLADVFDGFECDHVGGPPGLLETKWPVGVFI